MSFPAERRNAARGEGNPGEDHRDGPDHLAPLPSCSLPLALAGDDTTGTSSRPTRHAKSPCQRRGDEYLKADRRPPGRRRRRNRRRSWTGRARARRPVGTRHRSRGAIGRRCSVLAVPIVIDMFLFVQPVRHELSWVPLTWPLVGVAKGAVGLAYGAIENRPQRNQWKQHASGQHRQRLLVRHRIGPAGIVLHMRRYAHQVRLFLVRQAFARLWAMGALVRRQIGIMLRRATKQRLTEAGKTRWRRQRRCRDRRRGNGRNSKRVGRRNSLSARAARIDGRRRWRCRRRKEQQGLACRAGRASGMQWRQQRQQQKAGLHQQRQHAAGKMVPLQAVMHTARRRACHRHSGAASTILRHRKIPPHRQRGNSGRRQFSDRPCRASSGGPGS